MWPEAVGAQCCGAASAHGEASAGSGVADARSCACRCTGRRGCFVWRWQQRSHRSAASNQPGRSSGSSCQRTQWRTGVSASASASAAARRPLGRSQASVVAHIGGREGEGRAPRWRVRPPGSALPAPPVFSEKMQPQTQSWRALGNSCQGARRCRSVRVPWRLAASCERLWVSG